MIRLEQDDIAAVIDPRTGSLVSLDLVREGSVAPLLWPIAAERGESFRVLDRSPLSARLVSEDGAVVRYEIEPGELHIESEGAGGVELRLMPAPFRSDEIASVDAGKAVALRWPASGVSLGVRAATGALSVSDEGLPYVSVSVEPAGGVAAVTLVIERLGSGG
ncbi:MAG: hypothetical protein AAGI17_04065 [Planctomycetota bacterium]